MHRKTLTWVGAAILVFFMIRGMVPLIPNPIDASSLVDLGLTALFFVIAMTLTLGLAIGAFMAAYSKKKT